MEGNLMSDFIREMIGGVSNVLLNNPIIGWGGSLINIILGVCALVAITDIVLSFGKEGWAEKGIRFLFFFTLVLMNFGVINPRSVFDFQLGSYEYINKTAVDNKAIGLLGLQVTKPKPTLDRDVYNALARLFDDLGNTVAGSLKSKPAAGEAGAEEDIQAQAIQNTLYFLYQVRVAKMACYNNGNTPDYVNCLKKYVPFEADIGKPPVCKSSSGSGPCSVEGDKQIEQGAATGSSNSASGGWLSSITSAVVGDGIAQMASMFIGFFSMIYFIFTDFAFVVALPVILWILEIIRNIITLYFVVRYGFQASLTLMFAKIMSPLVLIPSKWPQVKDAYLSVLSTALFGFMSKLFVMAATILSLGLHSATYGVIAPRLYNTGAGIVDAVKLTAQINGLVYLVYFGIFVVLLLQIMSMTKITKACEAFLSFSVTGFVNLGKEIIGGAVNIALAAGAIAATAPLAAGAMSAGALVKGAGGMAGKTLAGGASKLASSGLGQKALNSRFGRAARDLGNRGMAYANETGSDIARRGMNSISGIAEYGFGQEVGAKAKQLFGPTGGVRKTPVSVAAAPNEQADKAKTGEGYSELTNKDGGSSPSESGATVSKSTKEENSASSPKGFGGQSKTARQEKGSSVGASSRKDIDPDNAFGYAESRAAKRTPKPFENSFKGPKFLQNPAIKAALAAGNLASAWAAASAEGNTNPFSGAYNGFKSGAGTQVENKFADISTKVSKKLDDAYLDEEFRNKVTNFNRRIDNVDSDVKLEAAIGLQTAVQAATSQRTLSGDSSDLSVVEDFEKFKGYQSAIKDGSISADDYKEFTRISSSYNLSPSQKKSVSSLQQNEDYAKYFAEHNQKQEKFVQEYIRNPNAQNAQNLQEAINRGDVHRNAFNNRTFMDTVRSQTQGYNQEFESKLSTLDGSRIQDEEYLKQPEVKSTMAQARRFASNRENVASLLGNAGMAQNLAKAGVIEKDYAEALSSLQKSKELDRVIASFPETIRKFSSEVSIGDNKSIVLSSSNQMAYINNGTLDSKVDGVSINDIKDESLKQLLIKQKNALEVITQNPRLAEKHQVRTDKLMSIFNFIKF